MSNEDLIRRLYLDGTSTAREAAAYITAIEEELVYLRNLSACYSESEKIAIRAEIAKMNEAAVSQLKELK